MNSIDSQRTVRRRLSAAARAAALWFRGGAAAIGGAMLLSATACNRPVSADQEKATAAPANNPMEIQAGEALMARVKLGEPSWAQVGASVTVAARIEVDQTRVARVGSPVLGRIAEVHFHEGQEVTRGQLLAIVNSTGLSEAELALLKAVSQAQLAQRSVDRAEQLLKAGVIGSAELKRREAELAQANADAGAAREQLRILGMPIETIEMIEATRSIHSLLRITASRDGTILERKIALGQVIQPADTLAEIADLSNLWLVADVPEQSAGNLVAGQSVRAEIEAFPGEPVTGRLSFVSATVNPETRTVRVRMDLANPRRKYKPSMLASMTIQDPTQKKQVIPSSAVVREGNGEYVFVQLSADRFLLRPVNVGEEQGRMRVLLGGVQPGERIVVEGAFHLNNERKRIAVQGG
jgi:cobalt-zinc-cadmium efflux system membrane fusion protein